MSTTTIMTNNVTQGMVSKKARRLYSTELLANSVSLLENVVPNTTGGFRLRPGLRKLYSDPQIKRLIPLCRDEGTYFIVNVRENERKPFAVTKLTDRKTAPYTAIAENEWRQPSSPTSAPWSFDGYESAMRLKSAQTFDEMVVVDEGHPPIVFTAFDGTSAVSIEIFTPNNVRGSYAVDEDGHKTLVKATFDYDGLFTTPGKFPSFVTFNAGRLWFARSTSQAQFLWASRPFDYNNFQDDEMYLTLDDSATVEDYLQAIQAEGKKTRYYVDGDVILDAEGLPSAVRTGATPKPEYNGDSPSNVYWKVETTTSSDPASGVTVSTVSFYHKTYPVSGSTNYAWTFDRTTSSFSQHDPKYVEDTHITSDCAMWLEVGSDRNDQVCWIGVSNDIYVGTSSSEFMMEREINATNEHISKIASFGSDPSVQVAVGNNNIYYCATGRKGIRTVKHGYYGPEYGNITAKCEELFESGIREMVFRRVPHPFLYVVLESGDVAVLCDDGSGNVSAWAKWTFGDRKIVSATVLDTENGQDCYFLTDEGDVCLVDETLTYDITDESPIDATIVGNFLDGSSVSIYDKSVVRYWVDSLGNPFRIGQDTEDDSVLSTVDSGDIYDPDVMTKIGAWSSSTNSFRWKMKNVPNKPFEILCISAELEIS